MRTTSWIKKLSGHAGELYIAAELSKRGIPNALLPENFSGDDIIMSKKDGTDIAYIQVKSCHPDRATSFILYEEHEKWANCPDNQYVAFVWLGSPKSNESPMYWIASKKEVGEACIRHPNHGDTKNRARRFGASSLPKEWKDNWAIFDKYLPKNQ